MIQKYSSLSDIVALAEFAHRNQTDQAGFPYINHPRRVMESVQAQGAPPYVQMAAILHDVTEDTAFTCDILLTLGVPDPAVLLVRLLDRDASKIAYESWADGAYDLRRLGQLPSPDDFYYQRINEVPEARMIKLADIADNTLEWRLSYLSEDRQKYLRNKYENAKRALGVIL